MLNTFCCFLVDFTGIVLLFQKTDKLKKLSFIMWPVADAFSKNFDATPPAILSRLKAKETFSLTGTINSYLKNTRLNILAPFSAVRAGRAANA